jgi:hypothetical protein
VNRSELILALGKLLRASDEDIIKLILTAPYQYKQYKIKKRTGGTRDIYHPTAALKAVQRWLISNCFSHLMIHPSVFSYREGVGIRQHATQHLNSNFLLRIDFKDFFPSIDQSWVLSFLYQEVNAGRIPIVADTVPTIARLVCRFAKAEKTMALSIGAPSSPVLSNAILYNLDQTMHDYCLANDCVYTRYADDIYISTKTPNVLFRVQKELDIKIKELMPKLSINDKKTINVSKKTKRVVTGLTITPDRHVSLGRELKRSIKTKTYLYSSTQLPVEEIEHLRGLIAYASDAEPVFYNALNHKFGKNLIDNLLNKNKH